MPRRSTPDQVKEAHVAAMGTDLGTVFHALYNDCAWLQVKWEQYVQLYGSSPDRVDSLNRAAALFFRVVQDALWQDTLLHLARLTDPPKSRGKGNLSVCQLPPLITDDAFRADIQQLVDAAVTATGFARERRNKKIAHHDLALALKDEAASIAPASRKLVKEALCAVNRVIQRFYEHYFSSDLMMDVITEPTDAVALLYTLRDGLAVEERRQQRLRDGDMLPEDLQPRAV